MYFLFPTLFFIIVYLERHISPSRAGYLLYSFICKDTCHYNKLTIYINAVLIHKSICQLIGVFKGIPVNS